MSTMETFFATLKIMGQGMAGIFTAIILIMIVVFIMGKIAASSSKKKTEEESDGFRIFLCSENGRRINAESAHYFRSNT